MSRGKYLSFEEAREMGLLEQFAKENKVEGDQAAFDALMGFMSRPESIEEK